MFRRGSLVCMLAVLLIGQRALAAKSASGDMEALASSRGCYLCHSAERLKRKADAPLPYAPSWKDIALMYRGQKDAENHLTQVVLGGSGNGGKDRHWKGKVREAGMLPNVKEIDEDEARQLVRWILSFVP